MAYSIPTLDGDGRIQAPGVISQLKQIAEEAAQSVVSPGGGGNGIIRGPGRPDMPETTGGMIDPGRKYPAGTIYISTDRMDGAEMWLSNTYYSKTTFPWNVVKGEINTLLQSHEGVESYVQVSRTADTMYGIFIYSGELSALSDANPIPFPAGWENYNTTTLNFFIQIGDRLVATTGSVGQIIDLGVWNLDSSLLSSNVDLYLTFVCRAPNKWPRRED